MLKIIKSFFSPVGGGRTSFASQNGNIQRKEDLRQGRNLVSNSDFNRKRIRSKEHIEGGGSVLNLPSFASKNIVRGGGSYARIIIQQAVAQLKEVKAITLA